ncbi:cytochrome P450 [Ilumatobacter nonamiensis]|uniref:cytochrome P450 n=1 Tax=Ilumatobacter nonamiensis TaxID=467093 RepID=UPI0003485612|nr:cytochrome P450 [Ilumatobacter nonamiensis]
MGYDDTTVRAEPVSDWVNDWDWLDPQWGTDAIDIWNAVREITPMAMTERYGRAFMPVTMDAVSAIAKDTENFSSQWVSVAQPDAVRRPAPPITSDPPHHQGHRRLLLPSFSPKQIEPMEDELREYCRGLIADLDGRDTADAAADYSQHIPVHGIAQMIGVPDSDADIFRDWIYRNFQLAPRDNRIREEVTAEMRAYFLKLLEAREAEPQDDLATLVAQAEMNGEPIDRELQFGYLLLLILAGIDTTWSAIGSGLWHLGSNPDDLARLRGASFDDPIWLTMSEEVLRYYAPVTMGRRVVGDTTVSGCPVHAGDQVLVTFPAANHDPESFDRADEFVIDREVNRHVAFGLGIHRCLGSNLARLEMKVAFQEWCSAFPDYRVDTAQETTWTSGQIRGPRNIPVVLR